MAAAVPQPPPPQPTPPPEPPHPPETQYPTQFQKMTIWTGISAFFVVLIVAIVVGAIYLFSWILSYLQPILVPVAVAAILAYLLEPVVKWLVLQRVPRKKSVFYVNLVFNFLVILLAVLILRPTIQQGREFFSVTNLEWLKDQALARFDDTSQELDKRFQDMPWWQKSKDWITGEEAVAWVTAQANAAGKSMPSIFGGGLSQAASMLGYLLGLLLVPIYLYFFLLESAKISQNWSMFIPLWESKFKDEVVSVLKEINGYLIAYFRGQMLVSIIDGMLIATALAIIQVPYWLLIGVMLAILGLIPYVGSFLVAIPACLITLVHFAHRESFNAASVTKEQLDKLLLSGKVVPEGTGYEIYTNTWSWLPNQWWAYVLIVIGIFIVLQQINSLVTAPKIVGDSVGLHPITVIFSMLFWSFVMGGILGALLAVPLSASVKVLFQRYIWQRRIKPGVEQRLAQRTIAKKKQPTNRRRR